MNRDVLDHNKHIISPPPMVSQQITFAALILCLTNLANSLCLRSDLTVRRLTSLLRLFSQCIQHESTQPTTNVPTLILARMLASVLLVTPSTSAAPTIDKSNITETFVAIGLFAAVFLTMPFVVFCVRMGRKRQDLGKSLRSRPPALRVGCDFPAEMKPAYLDSPRLHHSSIVAENMSPLASDQLLSPLAASKQPGFITRPVPANVPVSAAPSIRSIPHSRAASVQFSQYAPSRSSYGAQLLEDLSRHYVLTVAVQPGHHSRSTSLKGRPREFRAY
ncbi:hypothetical protein C8R45DRAFT_984248 [Mycena sanguinolenta]|nr:hypothetical protein C8R45DRAFT_984248 [Mycena sanguinolenta]